MDTDNVRSCDGGLPTDAGIVAPLTSPGRVEVDADADANDDDDPDPPVEIELAPDGNDIAPPAEVGILIPPGIERRGVGSGVGTSEIVEGTSVESLFAE